MHEPRGKRSLTLAYALSPTGADHMESVHDPSFEGLVVVFDSVVPAEVDHEGVEFVAGVKHWCLQTSGQAIQSWYPASQAAP